MNKKTHHTFAYRWFVAFSLLVLLFLSGIYILRAHTINSPVSDEQKNVASAPFGASFALKAKYTFDQFEEVVDFYAFHNYAFDSVNQQLYMYFWANGTIVSINLQNEVSEVKEQFFENVGSMSFNPDGSKLYIAHDEPGGPDDLKVYDRATFAYIKTLTSDYYSNQTKVVVSSDRLFIVARGKIESFDLDDGQLISSHTFDHHYSSPYWVEVISKDENYLYIAGTGYVPDILKFDVSDDQILLIDQASMPIYARAITLSGDGSTLAVATSEEEILVYDSHCNGQLDNRCTTI